MPTEDDAIQSGIYPKQDVRNALIKLRQDFIDNRPAIALVLAYAIWWLYDEPSGGLPVCPDYPPHDKEPSITLTQPSSPLRELSYATDQS